MSALLASVFALHLLFAGLWTGSVLFFTYALLPLARSGAVSTAVLDSATGKLTTVSRTSAVLQLLTGAYAASPMGVGTAGYWSSTDGTLVVAMIVLWLLLAVFTEFAASRLRGGLDDGAVDAAAASAGSYLYAASAVAILLLVDAGVIAGGL